jgi:SOS-response transcriptional repressor LexA
MSELRSTKKQKELHNFVDTFIQGNGYGPSYREIMRSLGYKSVSTVAIHIDGLIAKGYLRKRDNSARSLEVVTAHIEPTLVKKNISATNERWLIEEINNRFASLKENYDEKILDELYVLIGSLKVLGLEDAHLSMKTKLMDLKNNGL